MKIACSLERVPWLSIGSIPARSALSRSLGSSCSRRGGLWAGTPSRPRSSRPNHLDALPDTRTPFRGPAAISNRSRSPTYHGECTLKPYTQRTGTLISKVSILMVLLPVQQVTTRMSSKKLGIWILFFLHPHFENHPRSWPVDISGTSGHAALSRASTSTMESTLSP